MIGGLGGGGYKQSRGTTERPMLCCDRQRPEFRSPAPIGVLPSLVGMKGGLMTVMEAAKGMPYQLQLWAYTVNAGCR